MNEVNDVFPIGHYDEARKNLLKSLDKTAAQVEEAQAYFRSEKKKIDCLSARMRNQDCDLTVGDYLPEEKDPDEAYHNDPYPYPEIGGHIEDHDCKLSQDDGCPVCEARW